MCVAKTGYDRTEKLKLNIISSSARAQSVIVTSNRTGKTHIYDNSYLFYWYALLLHI